LIGESLLLHHHGQKRYSWTRISKSHSLCTAVCRKYPGIPKSG